MAQLFFARGRHVRNGKHLDDLEPGDYSLHGHKGWAYCDPEGNLGWVPDTYTVERHANGSITVLGMFAATGQTPLYRLESGIWERL